MLSLLHHLSGGGWERSNASEVGRLKASSGLGFKVEGLGCRLGGPPATP